MPKGQNANIIRDYLEKIFLSCGKSYSGKPETIRKMIVLHMKVCKACEGQDPYDATYKYDFSHDNATGKDTEYNSRQALRHDINSPYNATLENAHNPAHS